MIFLGRYRVDRRDTLIGDSTAKCPRVVIGEAEAETFQRHLDLVETTLVAIFSGLGAGQVRKMLDIVNIRLQDTQFYKDISRKVELDLLLRQLTRRCGDLSADRRSRVESLSRLEREALAEALLDFSGLADLDAWRDRHYRTNGLSQEQLWVLLHSQLNNLQRSWKAAIA